ncbi:MAG: hypothetical protein IKJ26_07045 [Clostridia bacterium]|nr:hypothetical protein [Clostridia bacterium]
MKHWKPYMLRPVIYMAATRLMAALVFLLAVVRFVPRGPAPGMVAGFLTALFALFTYLVYLRMDGMHIPRMKHFRPKQKKDPFSHLTDLSDYTDEEPPVTFDELEQDEKDLCSLLSNAFNLAVFLILSFII